jgi:hypothetical protein
MADFDRFPKRPKVPDAALTTPPPPKPTASEVRDSQVPAKDQPPKFHAGVGQPWVFGEMDTEGHLIGATQTASIVGKTGASEQVIRKLTLPPFPQRHYLKMQVGNNPPFELTLSGNVNTFTIKARNGQKGRAIVVDPKMGGAPEAYLTYVDLDANDQTTGTRQSNVRHIEELKGIVNSMLQEFGEYKDLEPIFREALKSAGADLSAFITPENLSELDPETGVPITLYKLGWGTIGRGVVWGIAGAVGVVLAAPAATGAAAVATFLTAYEMFWVGLGASVVTETWTAIGDGQTGGPDKDKKQTTQAPR